MIAIESIRWAFVAFIGIMLLLITAMDLFSHWKGRRRR